jgi:hypothetical protein
VQLILFASEHNIIRPALVKMLTRLSGGNGFEDFRSIGTLNQWLRRPKSFSTIMVLAVTNRMELDQVLGFRYLLEDCKLVLILSERDHESVALGHELRPRYLSFAEGDLADVSAVLNKMIDSHRAGFQSEAGLDVNNG